MLVTQGHEACGDDVERLVPRRLPELPHCPVAQQRGGEPFAVPDQAGGGPALRHRPPSLTGNSGQAVLRRPAAGEAHGALQRAVRAVGRDAPGLGAAAVRPARSMVAPGLPVVAPGLPVVEPAETTRPQIRASARPATLATPALRT